MFGVVYDWCLSRRILSISFNEMEGIHLVAFKEYFLIFVQIKNKELKNDKIAP